MDLRGELVFEFEGVIIEWRGPAPFLFVTLPEDVAAELTDQLGVLSYGWGCIPVVARIGGTTFTTSLFPRHGGYLLPVKAAVQRAEQVELGDAVTAEIGIDRRR